MNPINQNQIGRTKSRAHTMKMQGFPFNYVAPIRAARPTLIDGHTYVATPVDEEGVMLYSFKDSESVSAFKQVMTSAEAVDV